MSFENKRSCIAIDVSKGHSHFQGFFSAVFPAPEATSFEHTKSGFARVTELFNFLKEQNDQKPFIIFDHTGTYSRPIEVYCKTNNFSYMAIPPLLSAKMRKSDIRPTKTDKIDCATIANVYYLKRVRVTKSNSKVYSDLKILCSYYNFKVQLMVQMKVKYREHLDCRMFFMNFLNKNSYILLIESTIRYLIFSTNPFIIS